MEWGFHASHEQFSPGALLRYARLAAEAGFDHGMCSDHFAPWTAQGHSGFAWSWLGSALEATDAMTWGLVSAPGQRYHPAIVAQAVATLAEMYPTRTWAAFGSGQAMNEHITGERWPTKDVRQARLLESVGVIRGLLAGEEVSHDGLVRVDRARVWSLPPEPPPLLGAAVSPATAAWAASWADGLVTVNQPGETVREVVEAYRDAGGRGAVAVQVHLALADTREEGLRLAHAHWRGNALPDSIAWDLAMPAQFDDAARFLRPADVVDVVMTPTDVREVHELGQRFGEFGAERVYLHHVGPDQRAFLAAVGEAGLPTGALA